KRIGSQRQVRLRDVMIAGRGHEQCRPYERRAGLGRSGGRVIDGEVFRPVLRYQSLRIHYVARDEEEVRLGLISLVGNRALFRCACGAITEDDDTVWLVLSLAR